MNLLPLLEASDLSRTWGDTPVFHSVNIRVYPGDFLAISGESGAGKSTLLRVLGTLDRHYTGRLTIFEQEMKSLHDRALSRFRNQRISFVFQSHQLLPHLSAKENVLLPWAYRRGKNRRVVPHSKLDALFEALGLADKADALPGALSGGQQQRVAIARALITEPALLLCDELTGNLDRRTAAHVMDVLARYQQESDCALIVVSHDPYVLRRAKQHWVLREGRLSAAPEGTDSLAAEPLADIPRTDARQSTETTGSKPFEDHGETP